MRRSIFFVCVTYLVVSAVFTFRESVTLQFLFGVTFLGLIVSFVLSAVHLFRAWTKLRWGALTPLGVCVLVFFGGPGLGRFARDTYFRSQIPRLEIAVKDFQSTGQLPTVFLGEYPGTQSNVGDSSTVVYFLWGGGFPVKHTVLAYCSSTDPSAFFKRGVWRQGYPIQDHWWVLRD